MHSAPVCLMPFYISANREEFLDEQLRDIPFMAVLKLDAGRVDMWVLDGARGLFQRKKAGCVFVEENMTAMKNLNIVAGSAARLLKDCGHKVDLLDGEEVSSLFEYRATLPT